MEHGASLTAEDEVSAEGDMTVYHWGGSNHQCRCANIGLKHIIFNIEALLRTVTVCYYIILRIAILILLCY